MNKTIVKVLTKARDILKEKGWIQQAMACDEDGQEIDWCSTNARSYCLLGALYKAGVNDKQRGEFKRDLGIYSIIEWNDAKGRTKKQVIAALDKTIKRLSKA